MVYLAYHLRLQKYVVIKRIIKNFTGNLTARKEVDVLKNLHHQNLPQVYDFVQEQGSVYTVIDYVDGYDLQTYINQGYSFTEEQLILWYRQLADVLDYLHRQNPPVLHSDIKPGNIIINSAGNAVLIDFNISLDNDPQSVKGYSLPYASPEQIYFARSISMGYEVEGALDGRTDLYSLGATFYRILSGTDPLVCVQSPPLASMGLPYDEYFLRIVDRCMCVDREQRYPSAAKLLSNMNRFRRQSRQYRQRMTIQLLAALLTIVMLGGGVYCLLRGGMEAKAERYTAAVTDAMHSYERGDVSNAAQACYAVLDGSEYQDLLRENPDDQSRLLEILGNLAYDSGSYAQAASRYDEALLYALSTEQRKACLQGCIQAYAESGDIPSARRRLEQARGEGLDSSGILLAEAVICAREGNAAACETAVNELLARESDKEICARACVAAASCAADDQAALPWLERAMTYSQSRNILRGVTVTSGNLAQRTGSRDARRAAVTYGKLLTDQPYASRTDWLNYVAALRLDERSQEASNVLEKLKNEYPGDYEVLAQLAFVNDALGDADRAVNYCTMALNAWERDLSPDKAAAESSLIQNLQALQRKLGGA